MGLVSAQGRPPSSHTDQDLPFCEHDVSTTCLDRLGPEFGQSAHPMMEILGALVEPFPDSIPLQGEEEARLVGPLAHPAVAVVVPSDHQCAQQAVGLGFSLGLVEAQWVEE